MNMEDFSKIADTKKFKFKELKVYASTEWLADNRKKYRQVFDRFDVGPVKFLVTAVMLDIGRRVYYGVYFFARFAVLFFVESETLFFKIGAQYFYALELRALKLASEIVTVLFIDALERVAGSFAAHGQIYVALPAL